MERRLQKPRKEKACGLNDWRKGVEVSETKRSLAEVKEGRKEGTEGCVFSSTVWKCVCVYLSVLSFSFSIPVFVCPIPKAEGGK